MATFDFLALNPNFFLIMVTILSFFVGSLLNVIIYRLPIMMHQAWDAECRDYLHLKPQAAKNHINLWLPFSYCPQCKNTIRPWHNIPIVSYIFLRGKCAFCQSKISLRYPFIEILTGLLSFYVALNFGISIQTVAALIFTWISIALLFIDLDHFLLPDELTLLLLWIGLFFNLHHTFTDIHSAIYGAIIAYLSFALIQSIYGFCTGKIGMGQGDYKYLAAIGAYLGWQSLPLIVLIASVTGLFFTVSLMIVRRKFTREPFPFGPYLTIAGWCMLMWNDQIMRFYMGWF